MTVGERPRPGVRAESGALLLEARGEPEGRAFARLALDADLAAHQPDQLFRDGEAKPRTAVHRVTARTRVHLLEFFEDSRLIYSGDPDARVDDLQRNPHAPRVGRLAHEHRIVGRVATRPELVRFPRRSNEASADGNAANRCVFDGVADQVDQDLPQMRRIRAHARQRGADGNRKAQSALVHEGL